MQTTLLKPLQNVAHEGQALFRTLLRAMSEPGRVVDTTQHVEPLGGEDVDVNAMWLLAQTVLDAEVPAYFALGNTEQQQRLQESVRFFTGAQCVDDAAAADFVFVDWATLDAVLPALRTGTLEMPHTSATVVVQVASVNEGAGNLRLSGAGINGTRQCMVHGMTAARVQQLKENHALFPCGVDWVFASGHQVLCVPRSTVVEWEA